MKKKLVIGVAGLAAVALVGGTFAYFTQNTIIDNPFDTGYYRTVVTEDFNPEEGENWDPGVEVNKDIYVQNTGDRPVVVRVKFEESWSRKNAEGVSETFKYNNQGVAPLFVYQDSTTDGLVERDDTVVEKKWNSVGALADGNAWSNLQSDAWFYYNTVLDPGVQTPKLLDSVKLAADLDLGHFQSTVYYTKGKKSEDAPVFDESTWTKYSQIDGKITVVSKDMMKAIREAAGELAEDETLYTTVLVKPEDGKLGYSDADYVLSITIETVQATDQAVLDTFFDGKVPADAGLKALYDGWALSKESLEEE